MEDTAEVLDNDEDDPTRRAPAPATPARVDDDAVDDDTGRSHLYGRHIHPMPLSCL